MQGDAGRTPESPRCGTTEKSRVDFRRAYPWMWTVAFLVSAFGAYWLVRSLLEETSENPTRDRIRALIDEADQLLKTLDEQRRG